MFKELGPEQGGWDSKRGEHLDERNIRVMQDQGSREGWRLKDWGIVTGEATSGPDPDEPIFRAGIEMQT